MANNCTVIKKHTKVKIEESGRQAVFLNPQKLDMSVTEIDGCLVVNDTACDYWIKQLRADGEFDGVLVELKGKDVGHALSQLECTLEYLKQNGLATHARLSALIVCRTKHPSFNSLIQKTQARFRKNFKAYLKISTKNREYSFDDLYSSNAIMN